jgi:hypothetical protein
MTVAVQTFAFQLRHFARSVDVVDAEIFDRVRLLVYKYVKNELRAEYFEVLNETTVDNEPALKMFWSSDDVGHLWRVRSGSNQYTNAVAQAFALGRPIWLTTSDGRPISPDQQCDDEWSGLQVAPYEPCAKTGVRTVVAVPAHRRTKSIYLFESTRRFGITDVAKTELDLLGNSLAILMELYENNRVQSQMTYSAIEELQELLDSARFPRLTRPHFFVAFSNRADREVTTIISEVLRDHREKVDFTDWSAMKEAGNISAQISREITRSRFGVCYFSEPSPSEGNDSASYIDNPNVVFEAGMLHALTAASNANDGSEPAGWIPIREKESPPAPFDFASERTLIVPRHVDGELQGDRFKRMLNESVERLIVARG